MSELKLLAIGVAILAVFGSGWWVESQFAEKRQEKALEAQKLALYAQCAADKKLTSEVSNGLQKKLSVTNARLNELKRVHAQTTCVPVASTSPGRNAAAGAELAGQNGISTTALFDYAGEAERYRNQLESCQTFIQSVWNR